MPVLSVYPRGLTGGLVPGVIGYGKRTAVTGWSVASARRNTLWLYGVQADELPPGGIALTLTIRRTPPTSERWRDLLKLFMKRLDRLGMTLCHWCVEWQRRGTPHVHMAIWFGDQEPQEAADRAIAQWLDLSSGLGANRLGQHGEPIWDADGWAKYVAKHCSRGVQHYQRGTGVIPRGWRSSGRMWGHRGEWPVSAPQRLEIGFREFYQLRRWTYRLAAAQALREGDHKRAQFNRRRLANTPVDRSRFLGISEWVGECQATRMLAQLTGQGGTIRERPPVATGAKRLPRPRREGRS